MAKLADYVDAVADVLVRRGVAGPRAALAADAGMTVLRVSVEAGAVGSDDRDLADVMVDSMAALRPWPAAAQPRDRGSRTARRSCNENHSHIRCRHAPRRTDATR